MTTFPIFQHVRECDTGVCACARHLNNEVWQNVPFWPDLVLLVLIKEQDCNAIETYLFFYTSAAVTASRNSNHKWNFACLFIDLAIFLCHKLVCHRLRVAMTLLIFGISMTSGRIFLFMPLGQRYGNDTLSPIYCLKTACQNVYSG